MYAILCLTCVSFKCAGLFVVKRLTKGSVAEIDGRINVNDTLLKVFALLRASWLPLHCP
jgi:hypothetical protein